MMNIISIFFIAVFSGLGFAQQSGRSAPVQKMIFEEKRIEGKIRRPQLMLIQAEQRPVFEPMILLSLGKSFDIAGSVDKNILDNTPNRGPFKFENTRIVNIVP